MLVKGATGGISYRTRNYRGANSTLGQIFDLHIPGKIHILK